MLDPNPNEGAPARDDYSEAGEVAVTSTGPAAREAPTLAEFMSAVVAWPASPNDPGYVNLHYSMPNPKPTPNKPLLKGMGWPYKGIDSFVKRVAWINRCLGTNIDGTRRPVSLKRPCHPDDRATRSVRDGATWLTRG
jgi:hypothetical protein